MLQLQLMDNGRLFHARGAATGNARSPTLIWSYTLEKKSAVISSSLKDVTGRMRAAYTPVCKLLKGDFELFAPQGRHVVPME